MYFHTEHTNVILVIKSKLNLWMFIFAKYFHPHQNPFHCRVELICSRIVTGRSMDGQRALELMPLLQERLVFLTGGRDRRGGPVLSFPASPRRERAKPEDYRRLLQYLMSIPKWVCPLSLSNLSLRMPLSLRLHANR